MHTKRIAIIAIIAALPFTAMAGYFEEAYNYTYTNVQTPAQVPDNGTVKQAPRERAYQTSEPTVADQTHIATTAYVKGAYNDTIAAINAVAHDVSERQSLIITMVDNEIIGIDNHTVQPDDVASGDLSNLSNGQIMTAAAVGTAIDSFVGNKRVEIYTTWDTNDKTQVAFVNASSQSGQ